MEKYFKERNDLLKSSREGNSLYTIYQILTQSDLLLKIHEKSAFHLLYETLIDPLNKQKAQELAQFPTHSLEIYTSILSVSLAQELSQFKGKYLVLKGLKSIDEGTAKTLSRFKGIGLYLNELQTLNETSAKALFQFKGSWLELNGLQQIEQPFLKAFSRSKYQMLYLNGLQQLGVGLFE